MQASILTSKNQSEPHHINVPGLALKSTKQQAKFQSHNRKLMPSGHSYVRLQATLLSLLGPPLQEKLSPCQWQ